MSKTSKKLALILRHRPDLAGLVPGPGGWVRVDDLIRGMKRAGFDISRQVLEDIVRDNDKRRFVLSEDGHRIRAAQGHSIKVDLELSPGRPPDILWHGTARHVLDAIFAEGLKPMRRQMVHLSGDMETAARVGGRHGKAVVLSVNCAGMALAGAIFYRADNGVWLTDHVSPDFLSFA